MVPLFWSGCALAVVVLANVMESDVWIEDASVASIYMQLQAEDLGLGSCWCQIRNRVTEDEADSNNYVRSLLDIPYQLDVLSIIGIGYKDQVRKPFDESHFTMGEDTYRKVLFRKKIKRRENESRICWCRKLSYPAFVGNA